MWSMCAIAQMKLPLCLVVWTAVSPNDGLGNCRMSEHTFEYTFGTPKRDVSYWSLVHMYSYTN